MLDYAVCKNWTFEDVRHVYTERDTMLYALGIGFGDDPLDAGQLRFVYEKNLQAVPTMASVMGSPGPWIRDPRTGADYLKLVHGENDLRILKPLPPQGTIIARNRIKSITDKGAGKGAVMVTLRELFDAASGDQIAEIHHVVFLRADGGFSAASGVSDPPLPALPAVPERPADLEVTLASLERAALIYRLSGDYNPLHSDPDVARAAGFPRPILHGLCTYGMACRAALAAVCDNDASRFRRLAVRFTAPVYPGETIRFEMWRAEAGRLHLRAHVDARGAVVLNNGVVEVA